MSPQVRMSESAEAFARHVHDLHKDISNRIHLSPATIPDDPFTEPSPTPTISPDFDTILPNIPPTHKESINAILDEQVVFTRDGTVQRFLVRWHGRPESDCTWIAREDLQQLDPDLLEYYQSRIDALPSTSYRPPITRVYGRRTLWLDDDDSFAV
uniref:Chromo domain-containing protein n=1 Tax=Fagus sylvatica TaxID=28930 RepID=A0A2N9H353_FAGSY